MGAAFGCCKKTHNPLKDVRGQLIDLTKDFELISENTGLLVEDPSVGEGHLELKPKPYGSDTDSDTDIEYERGKHA
ncbi:myristylated tegument protein [Murine herpesvirus strain 4556]|uniref:Cytoplasmic envelopment protein 3 n=3 Tax=Orthoherpesviridae TaxID=3044472 RepID=O41955_MHV68|nr:myristylated tegument protein [Murid gammaherpesvirus 4]ACV74546.1 myristylated tegument protein [Murine herpesvirus strain 72]AXP99109.1 myristylated tegument protein [synthetic construct]QPD95860.1 myristylated tegument protein [Murine herpesvirus]UNZ86744.1 myristylated tegument protein [Murine herpesvirus strain 4556]AAB66407.1 myristylated tegument protein [Murid gammaherpesvirus 4]